MTTSLLRRAFAARTAAARRRGERRNGERAGEVSTAEGDGDFERLVRQVERRGGMTGEEGDGNDGAIGMTLKPTGEVGESTIGEGDEATTVRINTGDMGDETSIGRERELGEDKADTTRHVRQRIRFKARTSRLDKLTGWQVSKNEGDESA